MHGTKEIFESTITHVADLTHFMLVMACNEHLTKNQVNTLTKLFKDRLTHLNGLDDPENPEPQGGPTIYCKMCGGKECYKIKDEDDILMVYCHDCQFKQPIRNHFYKSKNK